MKPDKTFKLTSIALIREEACIGCVKCIDVCPVDAIFGSAKMMHTVIQSECIGCGLCVDPCPMDCIDMIEANETYQPAHVRARVHARSLRLKTEKDKMNSRHQTNTLSDEPDVITKRKIKQAMIAAALKRVEEKHK